MGDVLSIDKATAFKYFDLLADKLFRKNGIECDFTDVPMLDSDMSAGIRIYTDYDDSVVAIEINVFNIMHAVRSIERPFNPLIFEDDFAEVILNMYHAYCHYIQRNDVFNKSNLDWCWRHQFIFHIKSLRDPEYYSSTYWINLNEIQAEYYGIVSTYEYLCSEFPDVDPQFHEAVVFHIVNTRMQKFEYFINSDILFSSLADIKKSFEVAYNEALVKQELMMQDEGE